MNSSLEKKSADKGLETLQVWQKSMTFAVAIHSEILPILPAEEKWGLCDQVRRSAQSIPANIAEGYGRYYYQDAVRFCYIARGSLEETFSHLSLAFRLGYLPQNIFDRFCLDIQNLRRLINGYIVFLKKRVSMERMNLGVTFISMKRAHSTVLKMKRRFRMDNYSSVVFPIAGLPIYRITIPLLLRRSL